MKLERAAKKKIAEIKAELPKGVEALFISSVAEIGLQQLKDKLWKMLN